MHFASYYRWLVYQHLFALPPASARLLDIGSDDGGFINRLSVQQSVALDRSTAALHNSHADLNVCADGTRMPFGDTLFDHVLLSDVIEHVEDDEALVANATALVKPGGTLWLSTTASDFTLFPAALTERAEQSWGHVRKGYTPERLQQLIGSDFQCQIVVWPEVTLRHAYLLLWACHRIVPSLARRLAVVCFQIDQYIRSIQGSRGHIYIQAIRHN